MAVTQRRLIDNFVSSLTNGCTALDTTLTAAAFVNLPTDLSTTQAMPLVLADDTQGLYEIVLITGHNASSTSVTVIRGAQGTTKQAWPAGTIVRVSTTRRDLVDSMTKSSATALSDTHVGMEIVDTATGLLNKQTASQGFHPLAHVMQGGIGGGLFSTYTVGTGQELLAQAGTFSGNASSQGYANWPLPAGSFPNAIVAVVATPMISNTESAYHPLFFSAYSGTGQTVNGPTLQFRCLGYNNAPIVNTAVKFSVLVLGV